MFSWHSTPSCQTMRATVVSILVVGVTLLCGAFFIAPGVVSAQESCGYIYTEFGASEIRNCDNPFHHDPDFPYAATTTVAGQVVTEDGTVTISELGEEVEFSVDVAVGHGNIQGYVYQHVHDGYQLVPGTATPINAAQVPITATGTYSVVIQVGEGFIDQPGYVQVVEFFIAMEESEPPDLSNPVSVLFLPGIQASRLYETDLLSDERRWEPGGNGDARRLAMTEEGESENDIYTEDVVDEVFFGRYQFYKGFLDHLEAMKNDGDISDWETFAYDWRYSVLDVVENGTQYKDERKYPVEEVERLATENNSPVTLITHSNGGLLAKALVRELKAQGKAHLIDRIIFIGTPHTGTPKSIGSILHGYKQELGHGYILSDEVARDIIQNLPGAYGLLPTATYLSQTNDELVTFADESELSDYQNTYDDSITTINELHDFVTGEGTDREEAATLEEPLRANADMLSQASHDHDVVLDDWTAPEHIEVVEVVGVGLSTVKGFHYDTFEREECTVWFVLCETVTYSKPVPQFTNYGDQTVVATSALAYPGDSETFYFDLKGVENDADLLNIAHHNLTESSVLQDFISSRLSNVAIDVSHVYSSKQTSNAGIDIISVHSPVSISVASADGRTVEKHGSGIDTEIITEISGSHYLEFAGGKYVLVPSNIDYTVKIDGMATGSYSLRVDTLDENGVQDNLHTLSAATTTPQMQTEFSKSDGAFGVVRTDYNGDGVTDREMTLDGEEIVKEPAYTLADLERIVQQADIHPPVLMRMLLFRIDRVAETLERAETGPTPFHPVARQLQGIAHQVERMEGRGRLDTASAEELLQAIDLLKGEL